MRSPDDFAEDLAGAIDRRRLLRRAANTVFKLAAVTAVAGPITAFFRTPSVFAYPSFCEPSAGPGCPNGSLDGHPCGPSRCCLSAGAGGCNCSLGGATCKSGTVNCKGTDPNTWGTNVNCWTCNGPQYTQNQGGSICYYRRVTTCCDCKTSGCDANNRCISYSQSTVFLGCLSAKKLPPVPVP
jgi:hypothetical protein